MNTHPETYTDRYIKAADATRAGEASFAFQYAFALAVFGFAIALVWVIVTSIMGFQSSGIVWGIIIISLLVGFIVGLVLVTGLARGWILAGRIHGQLILDAIAYRLKQTEKPAPATPPAPTSALPAENDSFRLSASGRVVGDVPTNDINGFDPRDLAWAAAYLAGGKKFTEGEMEKMPLPSSPQIKWGKAEGETSYNRLMHLCVSRGIIVGRGGPGNPPGKLAISDEAEIRRLLLKQS